ncbi:MAG: hypothetical protein WC748_03815 [Legionellales bacterium]|jgi:hypothetical protein
MKPIIPPAEGETLLPADEYYGYDNGFFIHTADNFFSLEINGMTQARYDYSVIKEQPDDYGFQLRRTNLFFSGHVIDDSWKYVVGAQAGPDGTFAVLDAYIVKIFSENSLAQLGQFPTPFLRAYAISVTRQLAVEDSLVAKYFSTRDITGASYLYEQDWFKWQAAVANGYFTPSYDQNQDVIDQEFQNGQSYAVMSRLELKPFGTWKEFRDYNSPYGNEKGLLLGMGIAYQDDQSLLGTQDISGTVDLTFQGSGWSTFAMSAINTDYTNHETTYGAQAQGGVFVDEDQNTVELFSRYEWGQGQQDQDLSLLTSGFNYYIDPRHLKFTADFGYAFSSMGASWADETDGWFETDEKGQWVVRTQLQLVV